MSWFGNDERPVFLPQDDPEPSARREALEDRREKYRFDYSYHGLVNAEDVSFSDGYDAAYLKRYFELETGWYKNAAYREPWELDPPESERDGGRLAGVLDMARYAFEQLLDDPRQLLEDLKNRVSADAPVRRPESIAEYDNLFSMLDEPLARAFWQDDWYFAWQRLAGGNPVMLRGMRAVPDHFGVTEAHFARAIGAGDSLARATAEGRMFVVDYAIMQGLVPGNTGRFEKTVHAPLAAFCWCPDPGRLMPVAIQCSQEPGSPVFCPGDGVAWAMARTIVQNADVIMQGAVVHTGWCHLVAEAVVLSAYRELAPNHPVMRLFEPHFEFTLRTNEVMYDSLLGPGGYMEVILGGRLESTLALSRRGMATVNFASLNPVTEHAQRGVGDRETLGDYPFRDDALAIWGPLREWVDGYIRLYYSSDGEVAADTELAAFLRAIEADGKIADVPGITTVDGLVDAVASIIHRLTAYHAAINYSGMDYIGYPPANPTSVYGPAPTRDREMTEADLLRLMPVLHTANEQLHLMHQLGNRQTRLGVYDDDAFEDERVAPLLARFVERLDAVEQDIVRRNAGRPIPYRYMMPSRIPQSIHV